MSAAREWTWEDEDGNEQVVLLPLVWAICGVCRGNGKHSLAVDGHGITSEEWDRDWDDEMRDDYRAGRYDRSCDDCNGTGKVEDVDEDAFKEAQPEAYERWLRWMADEAAYNRMCEMERRYGA